MKKLEDEILALQLAQEERATQMKIFEEENIRSNNMSEEEERAAQLKLKEKEERQRRHG